jgi:hypothetical protein|nr:MAG TPA: hypothetical protein [Caudoviricetes sp.]
MNSYVQFVVCQHTGDNKKYLFYAPPFRGVMIGDEVLVDTKNGERKATVIAVCTTSSDDVEKILRVLAGAEDKPLKRVIGKYQFVKLDYMEDENNG